MPIRNEADYIERSLRSVLAQDYPPDRLEVLVADGISTDATREIVQQTCKNHNLPTFQPSNVQLIDNPVRIVPTALNIAIRQARGDIIIRVDGHCEIAPDYVSQCVHYLRETEADCVGGPIKTVGETVVARAIALAMSSPFGVGGATFRTGSDTEKFVDTIAFGAYRRDVFERIGLFDENLPRNQDYEFNARLRQEGGQIFLTPAIRSVYYSRSTFRGFWHQNFWTGYWKVRLLGRHPQTLISRHVVPALFTLSLGAGILVFPLGSLFSYLLPLILLLYCLPASVAAAMIARREGIRYLPLVLLAFICRHVGHGLGFTYGIWHFLIASRIRNALQLGT